MKLSPNQQRLLRAVAGSHFLKAHRDIEGHKVYQLHPLAGPAQTVAQSDVEYLCEHGLLDSNKKFPAATFWLTEKGQALVAQWDLDEG